jgi:hypothetical protein
MPSDGENELNQHEGPGPGAEPTGGYASHGLEPAVAPAMADQTAKRQEDEQGEQQHVAASDHENHCGKHKSVQSKSHSRGPTFEERSVGSQIHKEWHQEAQLATRPPAENTNRGRRRYACGRGIGQRCRRDMWSRLRMGRRGVTEPGRSTRRAGSTTGTAGFGDIRPESPPIPPGARAP